MKCRCILQNAKGKKNLCCAEAVPDSPFCTTCEKRHPEMEDKIRWPKWKVLVDTSPVVPLKAITPLKEER